jgi:hypothetical protein
MPPEITQFSDIRLKDYSKTQPNCQGPDPKFQARVKIGESDDLFVAYADNLRRMIHTAADNQQKLLEVINQLFTYTIDTKTEKRVIRVNPALTEKLLQEAVEKTRKYIMDLYIKCEEDYTQGVKIYTAIVESKNAEIVPRQIESLTAESDKLVGSVQIPAGALEEKEEVIELGKEPLGEEKAIQNPHIVSEPLAVDKSTAFGQPPLHDKSRAYGQQPSESPFGEQPSNSSFGQQPSESPFGEQPSAFKQSNITSEPISTSSDSSLPTQDFRQPPAFNKMSETGFDERRLPQGGKLSKKNKKYKKHSTRRNKH